MTGESRTSQAWLTPPNAWFLGLMALAVAVFIQPLAVVLRGSFTADQYSQMLVVPPLSVALIYLEQKNVFAKISFVRIGLMFFFALHRGFRMHGNFWPWA